MSIAVGVLLVALGLPLALGRVRPNAWYGFRIGRALEDERAWNAANRAGGRWLVFAGTALILSAILHALLNTNAGVAALVNGLVMTLGIIASVGAGLSAMNMDEFPLR